ncbi:MAG: hypothetical protein CR997_06315 [Acidobacteria bacterium]|nr:MAG: hypothetical protein CR997_06315 [Acidobacteriota bacterium]
MFKKLYRIALISLLTCLCLADDMILNYGQYEVQLNSYSISGSQYFDTYKDKHPTQLNGQTHDYKQSGYSLGFRYGASATTTYVVKANWKSRELASYSSDGFHSYYLGVQLRRSAGIYHAFQWNIGYRGNGSYDEKDDLPLGSRASSWEATGSYVLSLNPFHGYSLFDVGYRFRGGDLSDEITFKSLISFSLTERFELQFQYDMHESKEHERETFRVLRYPNESGRQQAALNMKLLLGKRLFLEGSFQKVLKGRNVFQTDGFQIGMTWLL